MSIQRGDQYGIPFSVKIGGSVVTPSNITDIEIQIETYNKKYSSGELTYDSTTQKWLFPLTAAMSNALPHVSEVQVRVKPNASDVVNSAVTKIHIMDSLIGGTAND